METYEVKEENNAIYVGVLEVSPHEPTISDVMMETMVNWGVDTVFGMVGHSNLGVADAMRRLEEKGKLQYFGIRHEGAAAFAASGYAKLTGKPAVCFGIAGPGATNMYTGMWDAKVDRVPLLALTGQVDTQVLGTGAFQEVDCRAPDQDTKERQRRKEKPRVHEPLWHDDDQVVSFEIKGVADLIGVGNGNPVEMKSFQADSCKTFNGKAMAVVRPRGDEGNIIITAYAKKLTAKTDIFQSIKAFVINTIRGQLFLMSAKNVFTPFIIGVKSMVLNFEVNASIAPTPSFSNASKN